MLNRFRVKPLPRTFNFNSRETQTFHELTTIVECRPVRSLQPVAMKMQWVILDTFDEEWPPLRWVRRLRPPSPSILGAKKGPKSRTMAKLTSPPPACPKSECPPSSPSLPPPSLPFPLISYTISEPRTSLGLESYNLGDLSMYYSLRITPHAHASPISIERK